MSHTTRFALALFLALAATPALAANQQLTGGRRAGTLQPFDKRFDGISYDPVTLIPKVTGNGDGFSPIGPTYEENFGYGDGLGLLCKTAPRTGNVGFSVLASANAACDTTCVNSACVMGFEAALADAGDILACSDATADACLCQVVSLDEHLLGCGANWEAPALGTTLIEFSSGVKLAHVSLLAQDIGPDMDADGLDIAGDQTNNDGVELIGGGMYGSTGRPLVPGVDPAFKFCASVKNEDESGADELWVGFRDATIPNVTWNSYNSYFAVGLPAGDFKVESEDDGANAASTDTTLDYAEGTVTRLCVQVSDAGVATCSVDGAVPAAGCDGEYTFDLGQELVPIIHLLHDSDVADEVLITEWEITFPSGTVSQTRVY